MVVSRRVAQTCRCTAGRYSDDVFVFVGGTDIIGCFAACCSDLPVYRGEIQCRVLGMAMQSWDETGNTSQPPFNTKPMTTFSNQ